MVDVEFYSMVLRKKIKIPAANVKQIVKKGRLFAVGTYMANGKEYQAWRILGLAKPKK
jgi:ribosomal protein L13E